MIYLKHNLKGNIASADGTKDNKMKTDILISELGKQIAVKPELVITYLRASGFNVSDNVSTNKLASIVADAITKSKKFTVLISEEILGNGRAPKNHNGDGPPSTTGSTGGTDWSSVDWAGLTQSTINLAQSLGGLFGKDKNKPNPAPKQQLQQYTGTIKGQAYEGMDSGTKWLIGLAIGIPAAIGLFFGIKHFAGK